MNGVMSDHAFARMAARQSRKEVARGFKAMRALRRNTYIESSLHRLGGNGGPTTLAGLKAVVEAGLVRENPTGQTLSGKKAVTRVVSADVDKVIDTNEPVVEYRPAIRVPNTDQYPAAYRGRTVRPRIALSREYAEEVRRADSFGELRVTVETQLLASLRSGRPVLTYAPHEVIPQKRKLVARPGSVTGVGTAANPRGVAYRETVLAPGRTDTPRSLPEQIAAWVARGGANVPPEQLRAARALLAESVWAVEAGGVVGDRWAGFVSLVAKAPKLAKALSTTSKPEVRIRGFLKGAEVVDAAAKAELIAARRRQAQITEAAVGETGVTAVQSGVKRRRKDDRGSS